MLGITNVSALACRPQKPFKFAFAGKQRLIFQVAAVEMKEIENVIGKAVLAAVLQIGLQQREAGNTLLILNDQFAIEQRRAGGQRSNRRGDVLKAVSPILAVAREQLNFAAIEPRLDPIAVEFDFVQPLMP